MISSDPRYLNVAFWHRRFECIHPFKDGNGRVGRFLLDAQLNALFKKNSRPSLLASDKLDYISILEIASKEKNLWPLCALIAKRDGICYVKKNERASFDTNGEIVPQVITSPFRLAPFFTTEETTLHDDFLDSRM